MDSDFILMRRMSQGDSEALAELYDKYGARVHSICFAILKETRAAEEATQDVFMKLWNNADRYELTEAQFAPWLTKVTRNAAIDTLRKERRRSDFAAPIDEIQHLPDTSHIEDSRWRELRTIFGALSSDQRDVIELAYYHGLSQSEISEHLSMPLGTVKTRIRMGMERLRGILFDRAGLASGGA
jgi:RNA polymerase sigma-70 factor (ECF subfamily)